MTPIEIYRNLRESGFPVKDVRFLTECLWDGLVISTEVPYDGYIQDLSAFMESHKSTLIGHTRIYVDADVDISDADAMERIYQEMSTKVDPRRSVLPSEPDGFAIPLDPRVGRTARATGVGGSAMIWDCTTPFGWGKEERIKPVEFRTLFPQHIRERAKQVYGGL
jgi:UbiD family decarboxylase